MKIRRLAIVALMILMVFTLAACGGAGSSGEGSGEGASLESLKTIGEFMDLDTENTQWSASDNIFVYAFELDGVYYRAIADMTDEQSQSLYDIDYADDDYEEQQKAILGPLEVKEFQNLSDQILTQNELDALVGKTGQDLLDDGWTPGIGFNLEDNSFWLAKGPFYYTVVFDGNLSTVDVDTIGEEEAIKDLTVKSAEFFMLGSATEL